MTETARREQDIELWWAARHLVKDMNPYEARHFRPDLCHWPQWAQKDVELAYLALLRKVTEP